MKVDAMVMPSGGDWRRPPEGTGGCRRRVSLMTPLRWGRDCRARASGFVGSWESSARILGIWEGSRARW